MCRGSSKMLPCWQSPSEPRRGSGSWSRRRARAGACGRACRRCCFSWGGLGCRLTPCWRSSAPLLAGASSCARPSTASASEGRGGGDGYAHWLIAANLASTGHLRDPLFAMEDTWLPGYHVLAAAVLRVFGLWQLGALKILSALLGLATLMCVYWIAPNVRQGRLAVILLALNPVFLFTSGSAVVEPLVTPLLAPPPLPPTNPHIPPPPPL